MTTNGGHHNDGVIFSLKANAGHFQLLHKFGETHHDGKNPYGSLLLLVTNSTARLLTAATMTWALSS
jgi:uncharacterized repeat protein (TIGR03803 family)